MKRMLCLLLALVLCVGLLPAAALAASEEPVEEVIEEVVEEAVEASAEVATEETPADEPVELSLDGDTDGFKAVTGDAVIEDGKVTLYGTYTRPDAEYGELLSMQIRNADGEWEYISIVGYSFELDDYEESFWARDVNKDENYYVRPGVTYYYRAVIVNMEDGNRDDLQIVACGETKSYAVPMDGVTTLTPGQSGTLPAEAGIQNTISALPLRPMGCTD